MSNTAFLANNQTICVLSIQCCNVIRLLLFLRSISDTAIISGAKLDTVEIDPYSEKIHRHEIYEVYRKEQHIVTLSSKSLYLFHQAIHTSDS